MSILELQDEMSGLGICSPLNPESGIDQRGFGILHRLLVSTNVYLGAGQELNLTFPVARYGVGLSFREVFGIEFCDTPQLAAGSFIEGNNEKLY